MLILLIKKINTITRMSQNCHSVPSGQGIIRCRNDSLGKHCTAGETKKNIVDVVGNQKKNLHFWSTKAYLEFDFTKKFLKTNCSCVQQNWKGEIYKKRVFRKWWDKYRKYRKYCLVVYTLASCLKYKSNFPKSFPLDRNPFDI